MTIVIKELSINDLTPNLLQHFNRYQEVRRCQYLQLMQIHVSYEHRSRGIGKKLFELCTEKAKAMGAAKLYISTHSSEESQVFYHKIGCMDAIEVNQKLAEHEPYDRQMEFVLE